ncbi:MAG: hypothetical protein J0L92_05750 [Deltaproteobacteria bacterium]|nr:hypothetical protein [Deltaproteobacteria bacterium]
MAVAALVSPLVVAMLPSCGSSDTLSLLPRSSDETLTSSLHTPSAAFVDPATDPPGGCERVPVYVDGRLTERLCASDAEARGLTVIDLSSAYAPHVFDEDPSLGEAGIPPYRATYLALADEDWDALPEDVDPEHYLELFGISPTFRVLAARLSDDERHACHAAIDDTSLLAMTGTLRTWTTTVAEQRTRQRQVRYHGLYFERERARLGLPDIESLAGRTDREQSLRQFLRERTILRGIESLQDHLICDELLDERRYARGIFDTRTAMALAVSQRMHVVVAAGTLDAASRTALAEDTREADFRAVLRTLRERVVDASAVIEDGSARNEWGTVLGRTLDPIEMRNPVGHEPLPNGAPDWISPATERAARALGWTSPEAVVTFFEGANRGANPQSVSRVAVELPARPRYHATHMELRAEIDRGDVWFEYPYTSEGRRRSQPVRVRPTLTLFARDGSSEVALVRWPTTIGGWKPERSSSGGIGLRYKESPEGPRLWRDVVAAPAWLPPPSTPDDELVRRGPRGRYVPNTSLFGPSYRSAYGLAMVMHHRVIPGRGTTDTGEPAPPTLYDEGVRAHGSVSYGSILRGTSHGCHRLYNHLSVRLSGFLLAHRNHVRHGSMQVLYSRRARSPNGPVQLRIRSRGYRYELTPPIDVNVLRGNVLGSVQEAPGGMRPLPRSAQADATASAAADENL